MGNSQVIEVDNVQQAMWGLEFGLRVALAASVGTAVALLARRPVGFLGWYWQSR